jgi:hypothetical protein
MRSKLNAMDSWAFMPRQMATRKIIQPTIIPPTMRSQIRKNNPPKIPTPDGIPAGPIAFIPFSPWFEKLLMAFLMLTPLQKVASIALWANEEYHREYNAA